jgi:hypothetical protein
MGRTVQLMVLLAVIYYTRGQAPPINVRETGTVIRFKDSNIIVDEDDKELEVCLIREGDANQLNNTEEVFVQGEEVPPEPMVGSGVPNDTTDKAEAGVDFSDTPVKVEFPPGETEACAKIPIIEDEQLNEDDEALQFSLFRASPITGALQRLNETNPLPAIIRGMKGTATGDPMFTVPLSIPRHAKSKIKSKNVGLCFEVHGIEKGVFNLFSDYCVSVNGMLTLATNPSAGNIISKLGIVAVDDEGFCHQISISLYDRHVAVDGSKVSDGDQYRDAGIAVSRINNDIVRIAVPNCNEDHVVFRVHFGEINGAEMLKLVVGKAKGLSTESHGLMGQFWNTPADLFASGEEDSYKVKIHSMTSGIREFEAELHRITWDFQYKPCLYGGDRQGFPVIEGKYHHYKVSGDIFNTDFTYSQFSSAHCQK